MVRVLSQLLVFALFVVVPVSFSTDNIPSLDAPCLKTAPLKQTRKATISIVERTIRPRRVVVAVTSDNSPDFTPLVPSHPVGCLKLPQGRAPPASSFV